MLINCFLIKPDTGAWMFEENKELCIQNRKLYFELQERFWDARFRSKWQKSEAECKASDIEQLFDNYSYLYISWQSKFFEFVNIRYNPGIQGCLDQRYLRAKRYPLDIKTALDNFDEIFINKNEKLIEELEKESYIRYRMEIIERDKER